MTLSARRPLVLVVVLAAAGLGLAVPSTARASCAAASLVVGQDPPVPTAAAVVATVVRGRAATVTGTGFSTCQDTGGQVATTGCESQGPVQPEPEGVDDVELVLASGTGTWSLGTVDAADDVAGTARWQAVVPEDVPPGPATLTAGASQPLAVVVG